MCNHQHTKNYFKKMSETCQLAEYIAARAEAGGMSFTDLPLDSKGKCVFHSHDLKWKRSQRCGERFLDLFRVMSSDEAVTEIDFREFWLTGSDFSHTEGILLENAYANERLVLMGGTTAHKPIRLRGAKFCDSLLMTDLKCVDIDFDESVFKDTVTLMRCQFQDFASFIGGCRFEHNFVIEDCVFDQLLSLDEAVWMQQFYMTQVDFREGMVCTKAHQLANDVICQFSDVRFGAYSSFSEAGFAAPVTFDRCVFDAEIQFENTVFRSRFQMRNPSIQEKVFFTATKPGAKMFESALDLEISSSNFGNFGQIVFQNANLYHANADFKEQLRDLEMSHKIEIREGCLLYRTSIERIFPYSQLGQALLEDITRAFLRFFEAKFTRHLQADVTRDLKRECIRIVFHTEEAMSIAELEALLQNGQSDLLDFFQTPPAPPVTTNDAAQAWLSDIRLQLQSLAQRFLASGQTALLQEFFSTGKVSDTRLPERLSLALHISANNVLIGNNINAGGNILLADQIYTGLPVEEARALAALEVADNLQKLDIRLQLTAKALQMEEEEAFTVRFETLSQKTAPALFQYSGNNLRQLMARTDATSLRQIYNAYPLQKDFGRSLAAVFVQTALQEENQALVNYLNQFGEIEWAEESLLNTLSSIANDGDTNRPYRQRQVLLGFATLLNRSKLYHAYALRLLDALHASGEVIEHLNALKVLYPRHPTDQAACNELLMGLLEEMQTLMQERASLLEDSKAERDNELESGWAGVEQQVTIYASDTWQEILVKARVLRDFGRLEDSLAALEQYKLRFPPQDVAAAAYVKTASNFTHLLPTLHHKEGVYIEAFEPMSHAQEAGILISDILIELNGKPVKSLADIINIQMKTPPDTPMTVHILRWDEGLGQFVQHLLEVPQKPLGVRVLPV